MAAYWNHEAMGLSLVNMCVSISFHLPGSWHMVTAREDGWRTERKECGMIRGRNGGKGEGCDERRYWKRGRRE